ncbi:ribonucleoside reductase [Zavarzinia compransoris]|uniref:LAGLIDADG family homing endonuclease n=1 Tax=Zavarzinia marina TaxID=2911065 RepID=UPI001F35A6E7|nr:LAGLIDADG family homing endonuclease [Zavarzinia marina]MCF4166733.1 ribonucleoside reductase [Zavarzinia marina]
MVSIAPISQQIWDMKYRLKDAEGRPLDATVEETWDRVAAALAAPETANRAVHEAAFRDALQDFRFMPAGRIMAGAGTDRKVTLFNCFVMGTIPDDMSGIFEHLREAALTMQQGGGIGYDFSTLRPKGAPVKGVGADASGPLPFMDVWDSMCRTIMSAGSRRGAMMATMRCDHPDIEAFIAAKRDAGRLRMFNLSVLVTDDFMAAVAADDAWNLTFGGTVYKTIQARELWDTIMRATYAYAEPGVIFIDRINRLNNLWYAETISATNPCVTADTWVHTADGPRRVADLVGRPFAAMVDGKAHATDPRGFFPTGTKPVVDLETLDGFRLRLTADHKVLKIAARTRFRRETAWTAAGALRPGDEIVLNDHAGEAAWPGRGTAGEGLLLGMLVGDGTLKAEAGVLSVWPQAEAVNGASAGDPAFALMREIEDAARQLPHRSDFAGWHEIQGRGEYRLKMKAIADLAAAYGMAPGRKTVTPAVEAASAAFQRAFLRALFDCDGSVQGTQAKGISIRLAQSDRDLLRAVQRMLARFGVIARLYDRRPAGESILPDGKGGTGAYPTRPQFELIVARSNVLRFRDRIGFTDTAKQRRLDGQIEAFRRAPNREIFAATVKAVTAAGEAPVFDVSVPGINAFDANGLYVHNCGEQPLPPYGACLLGSVNLARFVTDPFAEEAALDLAALETVVRTAIRMMDNVVDTSNFPLPEQAAEARAKRRIGLGVTGLADALIMCRARYGGPMALRLIGQWMKAIQRAAYLESAELAREKGPFPLFDREKYLAGESIRTLDADVRAAIAEHGIRNALLTSIAPTGTISLFADNVSSGLEPVFSFAYTRKVLMPDGTRREEEVTDYAYRLWRRLKGDAPLPDYFVDAQVLSPADHVRVQAEVQKYVDSSISKTINCPEDISFDAFKDVYLMAWREGCKGCTTYRPNDVTGSVLSVQPKKEAKAAEPELPLESPAATARHEDVYEAGGIVYMTKPLDRPEVLPGKTYKVRWPESEHALYITVNDVVQESRRRPFEVFINSKNMEHYAWTVALTRMISAVFRRGGDVAFVVEELKAVFDPRGGYWMQGRYVPSLLAAIGEVIEQHMIDIGFIQAQKVEVPEKFLNAATSGEASGGGAATGGPKGARPCPRCGQPSLVRQEGCDACFSCGYSKCG